MPGPRVVIDTHNLRYTEGALNALNTTGLDTNLRAHDTCSDSLQRDHVAGDDQPSSSRVWQEKIPDRQVPPQPTHGRHIGTYALTTDICPWVMEALSSYAPTDEVLNIARPYASEFHDMINEERKTSAGLHDMDAIELVYQHTLEIRSEILLAADKTDDPVELSLALHARSAGGDDHFKSWGKLLTGLDCDPPIIVQFPFFLMMCQAFTFEPNWHREDYVYSTLTGVDWARGNNKFNDRLAAFETLARTSVPSLDDVESGEDRCFWRIPLAYLLAMNKCENQREFKTPRTSYIKHDTHPDLVILSRAFDTMGSAYMCRDGAEWLDDQGVDSLLGSGLANDVMDLHTDVYTGETRNLLRLLYDISPSADGNDMPDAMATVSTILSSMLCEVFRGHRRAWKDNREDGRISSSSPPTWEIYRMAKAQITEAGFAEPLVCGLKRAATQGKLAESPASHFFDLWYDMVEDGSAQLAKSTPLDVDESLAPIVREIHSLWHGQLVKEGKPAGWGREFDHRSDMLLGDAGGVLAGINTGISKDAYKFTVAYGRLSMSLPYVAYHTVDAIIMAFGVLSP